MLSRDEITLDEPDRRIDFMNYAGGEAADAGRFFARIDLMLGDVYGFNLFVVFALQFHTVFLDGWQMEIGSYLVFGDRVQN
jgi:hypothetical protein